MKKKNTTERCSSRPLDCDGDENCGNKHHRAYARLMDALVATEEASEAIQVMPLPRAPRVQSKEWELGERETHRIALEEAAGLLWIVRQVTESMQSILYPCSHSERERERMSKRFERIAADPDVTIGELFADEDSCSCRRTVAKATATA